MSSPPKPEQRKSESLQARIERAVGRLKSLHDGDTGAFGRSSSCGAGCGPGLAKAAVRARAKWALIRPAIALPKRWPRSAPSTSLQTFCARDDPSPIQIERVVGAEVGHRRRGSARYARLRQEWVYRVLRRSRLLIGVSPACWRVFDRFLRRDSIEIVVVRARAEDEQRPRCRSNRYAGYRRAVTPCSRRGRSGSEATLVIPRVSPICASVEARLASFSRLASRQRSGQPFAPWWETVTARSLFRPAGSALSWVLHRTWRARPDVWSVSRVSGADWLEQARIGDLLTAIRSAASRE